MLLKLLPIALAASVFAPACSSPAAPPSDGPDAADTALPDANAPAPDATGDLDGADPEPAPAAPAPDAGDGETPEPDPGGEPDADADDAPSDGEGDAEVAAGDAGGSQDAEPDAPGAGPATILFPTSGGGAVTSAVHRLRAYVGPPLPMALREGTSVRLRAGPVAFDPPDEVSP